MNVFGDPAMLTGFVFLCVIVLAIVARVLWRYVRVNAGRRRGGLAPLRWRDIGASRMRGARLNDPNAEALLQQEREMQRQIEWEQEQASHEQLRTGTHVSRRFCKAHNRWCLHPEQEGHPAGGFNNPKVPDDWPPDLSKLRR